MPNAGSTLYPTNAAIPVRFAPKTIDRSTDRVKVLRSAAGRVCIVHRALKVDGAREGSNVKGVPAGKVGKFIGENASPTEARPTIERRRTRFAQLFTRSR